MVLNGLCVLHEEVLGVALLLYCPKVFLHVPVLGLYLFELLSADVPALLLVRQVSMYCRQELPCFFQPAGLLGVATFDWRLFLGRFKERVKFDYYG